MLHNQQLTYYNNKEAEKFLHKVLESISSVFKDVFYEGQTVALILIGGYGRGEGGIVLEHGIYHPHNNLDLLYIHHDYINPSKKALVNTLLQVVSKKFNIGIDMSMITKQKLMKLNGLVITYDMRYGHKTLLGNSDFLKNCESFSLYNIDPIDMRQLLVNRGTLLLINRLLLCKDTLSTEERKLIIKHTMKAIIGYGDALLYFNDLYHWSYAQKQSNMAESTSIDKKIQALYSEAILFRFRPNYDTYLSKDLKLWNKELLEIFSVIHLNCETINLSHPQLEWNNYLNIALENKSYSRQNLAQKLKSCFYAIKNIPTLRELKKSNEIISYMQLGAKGVLSLLFPYIAYKVYPRNYRVLFQKILHIDNDNEEALLNGFLTLWSQYGDTNFVNVLRTYNITLEKS
ncbi:MAG: hypothetical protein ACI9TV_003113 [Sulfurimonas sp.]|jgi:hypothetical protein|uniref:hypothetical protein n=1 Tax=Sulfurimonas sp. TaxID=2022749 RepID=UPI0039E3FA6D